MNPPDKPRRPFGLTAFALMMVVIMVLGGIAGALSAIVGDQPGAVGLGVTAALITAATAAAFAGCVWWWRGIDEAAREAHKWAWWWGGSAGMGVGSVFLLTLMLRADEQVILPKGFGSTPADLFVSGMMSILLFQLAGYTIAWASWWLKHR